MDGDLESLRISCDVSIRVGHSLNSLRPFLGCSRVHASIVRATISLCCEVARVLFCGDICGIVLSVVQSYSTHTNDSSSSLALRISALHLLLVDDAEAIGSIVANNFVWENQYPFANCVSASSVVVNEIDELRVTPSAMTTAAISIKLDSTLETQPRYDIVLGDISITEPTLAAIQRMLAVCRTDQTHENLQSQQSLRQHNVSVKVDSVLVSANRPVPLAISIKPVADEAAVQCVIETQPLSSETRVSLALASVEGEFVKPCSLHLEGIFRSWQEAKRLELCVSSAWLPPLELCINDAVLQRLPAGISLCVQSLSVDVEFKLVEFVLLVDRIQVEHDFTLIASPNAQLMLVSDETLFIGIVSDIELSQAGGMRRVLCHAIDLTDTVNVSIALRGLDVASLHSRAFAACVDVVELFTANDVCVMRLLAPVITLMLPSNVLHVHVALNEMEAHVHRDTIEALTALAALLPGTTSASHTHTLSLTSSPFPLHLLAEGRCVSLTLDKICVLSASGVHVFSAHLSQTELTLVLGQEPTKLLLETECLHLDPRFLDGLISKRANAEGDGILHVRVLMAAEAVRLQCGSSSIVGSRVRALLEDDEVRLRVSSLRDEAQGVAVRDATAAISLSGEVAALQLCGVEAERLLPTSYGNSHPSSCTSAGNSLPPFTILLLPTLLRWRKRIFLSPLLCIGMHWSYWRLALALTVFLFRLLMRNPLELLKACWGSG